MPYDAPMRALGLLCTAACLPWACDDDGGLVTVVFDEGVPPIPRLGILSIEVETGCRTPVVFPGETAPVRVRSPSRDGTDVTARVVDGPARLVEAEGDIARRPLIAAEARFNLECTGYGLVVLFARDAGGRVGTSDPLLCARPSGYDRACRSAIAPAPLGDWTIEQFDPTGVRNRRLAPAGRAFASVPDRRPLKLRLVFERGDRPATGGEISVDVLPGAPPGVAVSPESVPTAIGTGEATFDLASGADSGEFRLRYTGLLDGERREVTSEPFVVTAPPAVSAEVTCEGGQRPLRAFDGMGGLVGGGVGVACTLLARSADGPPVDGTRYWVLAEAGEAMPRRGRLDADGRAEFFIAVDGRPPVDAPPAGPSPLDAVVTVVGVVEGAETFEDLDGDGIYTAGVDRVVDVAEPYVDADDDGERGPNERFLDTDGDAAWSGPNGVLDDLVLHAAQARLRWVGPVADVPETLDLECGPPACSRTPVPGVHEACPDGADAYLLPGAVVRGSARPADRNGQCTTEGGAATLFVTPAEAARVEDAPEVPLGPCGLAGLASTPFTLRLKRAAPGPFTLGLGLPDGDLVERTLCAP